MLTLSTDEAGLILSLQDERGILWHYRHHQPAPGVHELTKFLEDEDGHLMAGETYRVRTREGGWPPTCTCRDYQHRRAGTAHPCKHGRAVQELCKLQRLFDTIDPSDKE